MNLQDIMNEFDNNFDISQGYYKGEVFIGDDYLKSFIEMVWTISRNEANKKFMERIENAFSGEELLYGTWYDIKEEIKSSLDIN